MKRIVAFVAILAICAACQNKQQEFVVEGRLSPATDSLVYLLELSTEGVQQVDSVKPDTDGRFAFARRGYSYPMLYCLALNKQYIYFAADSTTRIKLEASPSLFSSSYKLTDSDSTNMDIRQISRRKLQVDASVDSLYKRYRAGQTTGSAYIAEVSTVIADFKDWLMRHFIYKHPRSAASYFALCQQKDGLLYFNVADPKDSRAFSAVATAYDTYYPQAPYTPSLHRMALQSVAFARQAAALAKLKDKTADSTRVMTFPEVRLMDDTGQEQSLTDIALRHRTVLICFSAYGSESSPANVARLRELYKAHSADGFEIYDIAIDEDLYFWRNAVRTLPWVCVNDALRESLATYNVSSVPTYFLLKDGSLKRLSTPSVY